MCLFLLRLPVHHLQLAQAGEKKTNIAGNEIFLQHLWDLLETLDAYEGDTEVPFASDKSLFMHKLNIMEPH